jgi:hypothetical protein
MNRRTDASSTLNAVVARDAVVPDFRGLPARAALQKAASAGFDVAFSGSGLVTTQDPPAGAPRSVDGSDGDTISFTLAFADTP